MVVMVNQINRVSVETWEMYSRLSTVLRMTAPAWQKTTGKRHRSSISHGTSCCTGMGLSPEEDCRRREEDLTSPKEGCFFREGLLLNGPLISCTQHRLGDGRRNRGNCNVPAQRPGRSAKCLFCDRGGVILVMLAASVRIFYFLCLNLSAMAGRTGCRVGFCCFGAKHVLTKEIMLEASAVT